jgi:hypothetical protein
MCIFTLYSDHFEGGMCRGKTTVDSTHILRFLCNFTLHLNSTATTLKAECEAERRRLTAWAEDLAAEQRGSLVGGEGTLLQNNGDVDAVETTDVATADSTRTHAHARARARARDDAATRIQTVYRGRAARQLVTILRGEMGCK